MGRKRNIYIREFFIESDGHNICKKCGAKYKGSFVTTLRRHILKMHLDLYQNYEKELRGEENGNVTDVKLKFSVEMSVRDTMKACIDFVAKYGHPLSIFDSNAFKTLTGQLFEGLNLPPVNSKNIINLVTEEATRIKKKIIRILRGKLVSLKMDIASRHDRAVLGVNVQLINNKEIAVYSLAMLQLHKRHTAEYLKTLIEKVLSDFELTRSQIYSITTDNGRNMIKTVELMSLQEADVDENNLNADDVTSEIYEKTLQNISFDNVISVRCAAHTLQLAVKDFLAQYKPTTLSRVRQVVKMLRTPAFQYRLAGIEHKRPKLDVPTRWNSAFEMMQRLLDLKNFCDENLSARENLTDHEWEAVANLVSVLAPLYTATQKLQENQLLMGDFYKLWLELKLKLQQQNSELSKMILSCIKEREAGLIETDNMYAALFLDPRLRRLLTAEQKALAKKHLKQVVYRIHECENVNLLQPSTSTSTAFEHDESFLIDDSSMQSSSSVLRNAIREMEVGSSEEEDNIDGRNNMIAEACAEITSYTEKRIDIDSDLLEYWEDKKYTLPALRRLAYIVHAVPPTQVSV